MTPATSGRLFEMPYATWDPASSCWRTSGATSRSGSGTFSGTWPTSGSMRSGACFEHPTWGHATDGSACSLLPTPERSDGTGGRVSKEMGGSRPSGAKRAITLATAVHHKLMPTPMVGYTGTPVEEYLDRKAASGGGRTVNDLKVVVEQLLPTPRSSDTNGAGEHGEGGQDLRTVVDRMLPTPTTRDHKGANQRGDDSCLPGAVNLLPTPNAARGQGGVTYGHGNLTLAGAVSGSAPTPRPSPDGSTTSDDPPPPRLWEDG